MSVDWGFLIRSHPHVDSATERVRDLGDRTQGQISAAGQELRDVSASTAQAPSQLRPRYTRHRHRLR